MSESADSLKTRGNSAFTLKDYPLALALFRQSLALSPSHILHSNISACHAALGEYELALTAAEDCVALSPDWVKGYVRKGAALHGLKRYDEAVSAYETGLSKDPENAALKAGLESVSSARGGGDPLGNLFRDPKLFEKMAANPKTAPFLSDAAFVSKLQRMQRGEVGQGADMQDPRFIQVLGVVMGVDMNAFERPEGSNQMPPGFDAGSPKQDQQEEDWVKVPSAQQPSTSAKPSTSASASASRENAAPPADVEMKEPEPASEEDVAKSDSLKRKAAGNEAYKAKDFDTAIKEYQAAWDLHQDITYLTNLSAAFFEKGDYKNTIETCEKAIEFGREHRADFKIIAKAFSRMATSYYKQDDYDSAITYFKKSLTENRIADTLNKLREVEKIKKDADIQAYFSPEKAEEERVLGNAAFKEQNFPLAVQHYTEAIKRDPKDPRSYTNRAATYNKLAALPEALKDAESAITQDPTYVKAHIRKSLVLHGLREYTKSLEAIQMAADVDTEKKHTAEISAQVQKCTSALSAQRSGETDQETLARAMRDPEVASIMQDPVMNQILQAAQSDPRALQEHMKNPQVAAKIQKLINAGVIKTR